MEISHDTNHMFDTDNCSVGSGFLGQRNFSISSYYRVFLSAIHKHHSKDV